MFVINVNPKAGGNNKEFWGKGVPAVSLQHVSRWNADEILLYPQTGFKITAIEIASAKHGFAPHIQYVVKVNAVAPKVEVGTFQKNGKMPRTLVDMEKKWQDKKYVKEVLGL